MNETYGNDFFASISGSSAASARRIVPLVLRALAPRSVVDVGCGTGAFLAEFIGAGVHDVIGVDGYVPRDQLEIPLRAFRASDLAESLSLGRRFDLAVSLEVAEHLPPERGEPFVADLVALAPAVLFSAAIPGQGGTSHLNERWQDQWARTFLAHGYRPLDLVRSQLWDDNEVAPWYAQNTIVYATEDVELAATYQPLPLRVVHPRLYSHVVGQERSRLRSLREVLSELPGALRRQLERSR